ncbi:metallophosphoesterase [Neokomagataea tanensis]|nr:MULTISPECIES: metallophosphoesterase [Neokomagataea]
MLPEFPRFLILTFNWLFGAITFLAFFQLVLDTATLFFVISYRHSICIPVFFRATIGLLAAFLSACAVWNATRLPKLRNIAVAIPNLPPEFENYTILQLADLHLTRLFPTAWAEKVTILANAKHADLIVITGDFIDGPVSLRKSDIAPLKRLYAPDGVFAVPGNHEYYFNYQEWLTHLKSLDITMLLNEHTLLTRGDATLVLAGVTDLSAAHHNEQPPNLDAALKDAPAAPIVLLDHQPRNAVEAAKRKVALQLSGHTHGGMIPGLDRLVARANNGFVSGRYTVGAMHLYVSNGTGIWAGFALRLAKPPEITCFQLNRTEK